MSLTLAGRAFVLAPVDDFSQIQALVTLDENLNGMLNRGIFRQIRMVSSPPYALFGVEFGARGYAGADYLLKKVSGRWSIVGHGKPGLGVSEILAAPGMSQTQAIDLAGSNCPARWFPGGAKAKDLANAQAPAGSQTWRTIVPQQPATEAVVVRLKDREIRFTSCARTTR